MKKTIKGYDKKVYIESLQGGKQRIILELLTKSKIPLSTDGIIDRVIDKNGERLKYVTTHKALTEFIIDGIVTREKSNSNVYMYSINFDKPKEK